MLDSTECFRQTDRLSSRVPVRQGINDFGQVSGTMVVNGQRRAFRYDPDDGTFHNLGVLDRKCGSSARAVNVHGDVVGYAGSSAGDTAFLYTDSTGMLDLWKLVENPQGTSGPSNVSINDSGQVCGTVDTASGPRAFFLTPTKWVR